MKSNFIIQNSASGKSGDEFYSRIVNFHQIPGAWKCIFKVQRTSVTAYDHFLSFKITSNLITHNLWRKSSQKQKPWKFLPIIIEKEIILLKGRPLSTCKTVQFWPKMTDSILTQSLWIIVNPMNSGLCYAGRFWNSKFCKICIWQKLN